MLEEEQEKILNKLDIGFQAWLRNLTQVQLEKVAKRVMEGHGNEKKTIRIH